MTRRQYNTTMELNMTRELNEAIEGNKVIVAALEHRKRLEDIQQYLCGNRLWAVSDDKQDDVLKKLEKYEPLLTSGLAPELAMIMMGYQEWVNSQGKNFIEHYWHRSHFIPVALHQRLVSLAKEKGLSNIEHNKKNASGNYNFRSNRVSVQITIHSAAGRRSKVTPTEITYKCGIKLVPDWDLELPQFVDAAIKAAHSVSILEGN